MVSLQKQPTQPASAPPPSDDYLEPLPTVNPFATSSQPPQQKQQQTPQQPPVQQPVAQQPVAQQPVAQQQPVQPQAAEDPSVLAKPIQAQVFK